MPLPARQRLATSSFCRVLFRPGWPAFLLSEDSREDLVDIPQLSLEIESQLDLPARDTPRDLFIAGYQLVEVQAFRPGMHGMALDHTISIFPGYPVLHQVEQQLSAENQTTCAFQVGQHAIRIDEQCVDQVGRLV